MRVPASRRGVVVEAVGLLAAVRVGLALFPYSSIERRLARWAHARPAGDRECDDAIERVVWAVEGVSRRLRAMSCLTQALVAHAMLTRRRVPAIVRLGVRTGATAGRVLDAHAWVESSERVVLGELPDLDRYQLLEPPCTRLTHGIAALLRGERVAWPDLAASHDAFIAYCDDGDLSGLVHRALSDGAGAGWPPAVTQPLVARARAAAALELARSDEIRRVLDALAGADVHAVVFKGSALAYSTYPHPALRPRADTDVLIRRGDRDVARDALLGLGYRLLPSGAGDLVFRQFEMQRRDEHGLVYAIDLHWQISNQERFASMFDEDELWERSVRVPALGAAARAAGPADALLLSCIHPVMHHRDDERLIWIYDTHLIASSFDDRTWATFTALARAKSIAAICAHGLALAETRFGTIVPAAVTSNLHDAARRHEPSASYLMPRRRWRDEVFANLGALPGWRARLGLLREMAFPPAAYVRRAYALDDSRLGWILLPVLYAHRGIKGVLRNTFARSG